MIHVCNFKADSVATFAAGACGDAAPLRTIAGPRTGLVGPVAIARDRGGRLHVANVAEDAGLTIYPAGACGDVAPSCRLRVAGVVRAVAVGPAGDVFVARTSWRGRSAPAVLRFAAGSAHSDGALCGPATGLAHPVALAVDAGGRLFVANGFGGVVAVYGPGAAGDAAPVYAFTPACGDARSLAAGGRLLAVGGWCICIYDHDAAATDSAAVTAVFGHSPNLALRGADGLALELKAAAWALRVADFAADAVHAIGPSARASLHGPATGLAGPIAVCVDAGRSATAAHGRRGHSVASAGRENDRGRPFVHDNRVTGGDP